MNKETRMENLKRLAAVIAGQFGADCEVVIHDLEKGVNATIVAIENGNLTERKLGDGPSHAVLEAVKDPKKSKDMVGYFTRTKDGKVFKSSTFFLRDDDGKPLALIGINFNITSLIAGMSALDNLIGNKKEEEKEKELITTNVTDLLENLIDQAILRIGKPVAMMDKSEKARVVNDLNDAGALLITKSSDRICEALGITKYALYNFINQNKTDENE